MGGTTIETLTQTDSSTKGLFVVFHEDKYLNNDVYPKTVIRKKLYGEISQNLLTQFEPLVTPTISIRSLEQALEWLKANPLFTLDGEGFANMVHFNTDKLTHKIDYNTPRTGVGWGCSEIGIWASNYTAWKNFLKTDADYLILCEDDLVVTDKFAETIKSNLAQLPETWDVFFQYAPLPQPHDQPFTGVGLPNVCKPWQTWSHAAYIISRKGAEKAIKEIESGFPIPFPADWMFLCREHDYETYTMKPWIPQECRLANIESTHLDPNKPVIRYKINNSIPDTATFFPYIQSWEKIEHLVLQMEEDFLDKPYKVINSTDKIYNKPNWIDQGDFWYYGSFYTALKDFNPKYDYFAYICGDMTAISWKGLLDKAQDILKKYPVGGLSFISDVEHMNEQNAGIGHLESNINMRYQVCLDGQVVFYHKSIIAKVLQFFHYLNEKIDILSIKHGWGVDMVISAFAINMQQPLVKYDRIKIFNTSAYNYDLEIGFTECDTFLNVFREYCNEYKLHDLLDTFEMILKRIGYKQPVQQLKWNDFYLGVKPF